MEKPVPAVVFVHHRPVHRQARCQATSMAGPSELELVVVAFGPGLHLVPEQMTAISAAEEWL